LESLPGQKLEGDAVRSFQGELHAGLANTLRSTGRFVKAIEAWDQAIQLGRKADRDRFLAGRAVCQACLGDHTGASETVKAATNHKPELTVVWYDAACAVALCCPAALKDSRLTTGRRHELADQYARQALQLLSLAAADHMFTDFQIDLLRLETDRDLDALRSRADFQKLVAEQQALAQRSRATPDR
jgi:tetratricopeptide (TPR) repeat protein